MFLRAYKCASASVSAYKCEDKHDSLVVWVQECERLSALEPLPMTMYMPK